MDKILETIKRKQDEKFKSEVLHSNECMSLVDKQTQVLTLETRGIYEKWLRGFLTKRSDETSKDYENRLINCLEFCNYDFAAGLALTNFKIIPSGVTIDVGNGLYPDDVIIFLCMEDASFVGEIGNCIVCHMDDYTTTIPSHMSLCCIPVYCDLELWYW